MSEEPTTKGNAHFATGMRKYSSVKHTKHPLKKKVFDDALKKAEKLGITVSEYLSRIVDETHDLE